MGLEKDGTGERFDPTKPFKTRDGREVAKLIDHVDDGREFWVGCIYGAPLQTWRKPTGKSCLADNLDLVNVATPSPDPHGAQATGGEDVETPAEAVLRGLASYLGVGGYNADTVDADVFDRKIRDGIDMLVAPFLRDAQRYRRLRSTGAAPNGTLHLEKGLVFVASNLDKFLDLALAGTPVAPSHAVEMDPDRWPNLPTSWRVADSVKATGNWQTLQALMLKFAAKTDYEPTDAELAALSPEDRGVVKGWRMRGEAMAAGAKPTHEAIAALRKDWTYRMTSYPDDPYRARLNVLREVEAAIQARAIASPLAGSAEAGGVSDAEVEAGR